jgi:hypothetical protein
MGGTLHPTTSTQFQGSIILGPLMLATSSPVFAKLYLGVEISPAKTGEPEVVATLGGTRSGFTGKTLQLSMAQMIG